MTHVSEIPSAEMSDSRAIDVLRACAETFAEIHLTVTGACMEPALRDGEQVALAPPARVAPGFGDVVLARHADGVRLHRVIWAFGDRVRTKGDRSPRWDAPLPRRAILGTIVGSRARPMRDRRRALASLLRGLMTRAWEFGPGRHRE